MNLKNLIDYCNLNNLPGPFAGAHVPAPLNLDTTLSAINIRCGLLTPVYGEPDTFRDMVSYWFDAKQWTFEHLIKVIQAEYSPIENYDRYEDLKKATDNSGKKTTKKTGTYSDSENVSEELKDGSRITDHSGKDTEAHTGTDTTAHSGTDTTTHSGTDTTAHSGTDTTTNTISAFNSSTYQPDNKTDLLHGESIGVTHGESIGTTHGESIGTTHGENINTTYGQKITEKYGEKKDKSSLLEHTNNLTDAETSSDTGMETNTNHIHGNIGVTTNQDMIEQELELLRHFDIYGYIAEMFEKDNMLMVY